MSRYEDQVGVTYAEAVAYLKSIGQWEEVIKSAGSDGYSIIAAAIHFRNIDAELTQNQKDILKAYSV